MNAVISGGLACSLYIISTCVQLIGMKRQINSRRTIVIATALLAIALHAAFSYHEILTPAGINMGIYPMASLTSLAIAAIVVLSSLRRPVENLLVILLPFATLSVILALLQDGTYTPRSDVPVPMFLHIALSIIAYGVLAIAAFQAALLSFGDYELKHRKLSVLKTMPPLQTMESLLFELLWAGLIFLSFSILSGFLFVENLTHPGLIHHASITLLAWIVFAVLLWGRHQLGWRGAIASRWTLTGFVLLVLGYFGSKVVIEIILGRA